MKYRFLLPVLASAVLCIPAVAGDAPKHDMIQHHAEMCSDLYAGAVGKLATLEVELKLTAAQKPLFERWKSVKLASAKTHSDKCAGMQMPGPDISIMDGLKHETGMLEARLADLRAEAPALEALVNTLDKDQQETLKRAAMHAMHERAGHMEHMMDFHEHMRGMQHRDGGMRHGDVPPPAE